MMNLSITCSIFLIRWLAHGEPVKTLRTAKFNGDPPPTLVSVVLERLSEGPGPSTSSVSTGPAQVGHLK